MPTINRPRQIDGPIDPSNEKLIEPLAAPRANGGALTASSLGTDRS